MLPSQWYKFPPGTLPSLILRCLSRGEEGARRELIPPERQHLRAGVHWMDNGSLTAGELLMGGWHGVGRQDWIFGGYYHGRSLVILSPRKPRNTPPPPLLILWQLSLHYPSDGHPLLNVAFPVALVPILTTPFLIDFACFLLLFAVFLPKLCRVICCLRAPRFII